MPNGEFVGSGLCGWVGSRHLDAPHVIARMCAPLPNFNGSAARLKTGSVSGIAVAGTSAGKQSFDDSGVFVAVCGMPRFKEARWQEEATSEGFARTLGRCWQANGDDVCASLAGEFSLAIVDESQGRALLAVDRMGTRPLYYQLAGNTLLFGSSVRVLAGHPLGSREIDPQSIYNYVYFHMVPAPDSIYKGVKRMLPGECLAYRNGGGEVRRYWRMHFVESHRPPFGELKEQFLSLVQESVAQAAGHARTGAFLSGGTDSSTIAGMLSKAGSEPARTYSIGFEAEGYDEMAYARIAARHFGTDHHEYYVTPDDVVDAIPEIASVFDQPFGNASAVPSYYCARMAQQDGIERMLGGDGGDELFGGNERYAKQHVFSLYERLPVPLRASIVEPIAFGIPGGQRIPLVRKARSYIEQATIPMPARLETYNLLERYGCAQVFSTAFIDAIDASNPLDRLNEVYRQSNAHSLINRMLALDLKITLADNDLPKVTKACELAGMDVAFPFLNDELVAFSAKLAPELKLKGTRLRYFFKEALRETLPEEIITKQKHGFGLPFGVWLQNHKRLQALASESLTDLKARGFINARFVDELLGKYLREHAGYHGTMVWVLMMLEQWFKQHQRLH